MKISVVVPVYNVHEYVVEFLESLVAQNFADMEAILVDDGSTDGTSAILDDYEKKYEFIKVIHKSNGGCMSAWKKGLECAIGDYITFADPDDILMPDIYKKEYNAATDNDADIVICGVNALREAVTTFYNICAFDIKEGLYCGDKLDYIKYNLFGNDHIKENLFHFLKMNKLFKRELIYNNLQYSVDGINFGEDVCICATAILDCKRLYYIDEQLYLYRIRSGSITRTKFKEQEVDNSLLLINAVEKMLHDKGYDGKFVRIYDQSYHISRLVKKISSCANTKKEKKEELGFLADHELVTSYDLKNAKRYLGFKRYQTVKLLKRRKFGVLLLLGKYAAKRSNL